jgi:hypothetical protein
VPLNLRGAGLPGQPLERLRLYLRQLSPAACTLLLAEFERALLRGEEVPGGELVLQEVRRALREGGGATPRIDRAARVFFQSLEPFLTDYATSRKHQGRIARASLDPIWLWICRELVPEGARSFSAEVNSARAVEDAALCERLTAEFQGQVADAMAQAFAAAQNDQRLQRRLAAQIGPTHLLEDVRDVGAILKARDTLTVVGERLPGHVGNLADGQLDSVKTLLDPFSRQTSILSYALVVVMSRLAAPWQLVRLATRAAASDDTARVAATPYATAVALVLAEIESMVAELRADLRRGNNVTVTSLLKSIHDAARGVRTELNLDVDSPWSRQLAAARAEISDLLKRQIESTPARVRRLLRPRPAGEIVPGAALDSEDVADTEALIELISVCRNYAGELAVSEVTKRCFHELEQHLDTGTPALLDGLRVAGPADLRFRQSQVDAAVRFCGKVFGQEYASLLTKAAEVATHRERKAVARV